MSPPSSYQPALLSAAAVVESVERQILEGVLAPGDKLPSERSLAAEFGISRPVVREGLRRLQERGLIVSHSGRGSFVCALEPTRGLGSVEQLVRRGAISVRQLVVARAMLESETAGLAAGNRSDVHLQRMSDLVDALERPNALEDIAVLADLDVALHETIVIASGNPVLQIMFGSIRDFTRAMVLRSLTDRATRDAGLPLHRDVVDMIADRDVEGARATMRQHILRALDHYGPDIDRPLASVVMSRRDHAPELEDLLREVGSSLSDVDEPRGPRTGRT